MNRTFLTALLAAGVAAPVAAQVDMSTWQVETYGVSATQPAWNFSPTLVSQLLDSDSPSLAFGGPDVTSQGTTIDLLALAAPGFTDDVVGIALGVGAGVATDANADYLLLKWNGASELSGDDPDCTPGGIAPAGLRLYRVRGIPTPDEFWQGADFDEACSPAGVGLELLAAANNLGVVPYTTNTVYQLNFELGPCNLRIDVDGVREFEVNGDFESLGGVQLGVFCMSKRMFAGPMNLAPLASPASITPIGTGTMGTSSIPAIVTSGCPTNGGTFHFDFHNSSDVAGSFGLLGVGPNQIALPLAQYAATLYTLPSVYIPISAPAGGFFPLDVTLTPDVSLIGVDFFAQAGWLDPGATGNVAFTQAMQVVVGS
ncbi:MAG: hypothetical protein WD226_07155 [Planctomycetota bacterium]